MKGLPDSAVVGTIGRVKGAVKHSAHKGGTMAKGKRIYSEDEILKADASVAQIADATFFILSPIVKALALVGKPMAKSEPKVVEQKVVRKNYKKLVMTTNENGSVTFSVPEKKVKEK